MPEFGVRFPVSAVWKKQKMFLPHPRVKVSIVGSFRDGGVACSASDRQGSNFESCVWRTVSSQSSHHLQKVLLAQFSIYVHKGGLKPKSSHLDQTMISNCARYVESISEGTNERSSDHVELTYYFVLILGHRLRRWPNMKPTVDQLLVFTGLRIPNAIQIWDQRYVRSADATPPGERYARCGCNPYGSHHT